MIKSIEHRGQLVEGCGLAGERRADNVAPAHVNGLQLSRDRFLLLISTLGFRGVDDTRSGIYQIRAGSYDGRLVREGWIARSIDNWDPLEDGSAHVRQYGHFTALGVPRAARIDGATPAHANRFAVKWRRVARKFGPDRSYLLWYVDQKHPELTARTQAVEWMQFRLNDAGDDLEIVQPARVLRQKDYEEGERFCAADVRHMNNTYSHAVPFNADATEWIDCCHFDGGRIAPLKYRFDPQTNSYEWVATGPLIGGLFEASVAHYNGSWVIAARPRDPAPIAWMRCEDPFRDVPAAQRGPGPRDQNRTPLAVYTCPDGVLRLVTGDPDASPHGMNRNPLYVWDVDPDRGFALSNQRLVFDAIEAGLPITMRQHPIVDMGKIFPHAGGRTQFLAHRVRSAALLANDPDYGIKALTPGAMRATSVYHACIEYTEDLPGVWAFDSPS